MSRGHGASRRRNYGPRQRDVRRRASHPVEAEPRVIEWPRGASWSEPLTDSPDVLHRPGRGEAA